MASVAELLRHLAKHAPGMSEADRAEAIAAVDREFGPHPTPQDAESESEGKDDGQFAGVPVPAV